MSEISSDQYANVPLGKASTGLLFEELRRRSKALAICCILRDATPDTAIRQFYGCDDGGENLRLLGAVNLLHDDVLRDVRTVVMGAPMADATTKEFR